MPNQPKTPGHTIRVPDDEWIPARDKAAKEGETMTDVIRRALRKYVIDALAVVCLLGAGYLVSGVRESAPEPIDNTKTVWTDITPRRAPAPTQAPTPRPTPKPTDVWEGI